MNPSRASHSGSHFHGHDHGGHAHLAEAANGLGVRRALWLALLLTAGFAIIEGIGGWLAGSLALLSDAGHMTTDVAALGLALFANAIGRRPPTLRASYGYGRAEVLAAFVNAIVMLGVVAAIAIEAVRRLLEPTPVAGPMVLGIATAGLLVNIVCAWLLSGSSGSINARGALIHVLGDLLGSLAAIVAGGVIMATGWMPIDPILSLVVSLLILRSTLALLRQSTGVLMEGVPGHLDYNEIGKALARLPGVSGVHDLHVWNMTAERPALSAHISLTNGAAWPQTLARAQRMLAKEFAIEHVTLQPDWPALPAGKKVIPVAARESSLAPDADSRPH
ncbi:MAG TPA: cation diffusion facilitator family transporter [Casimicrobiaceae bacterium]|nr:cation diffusion facilitator family transporter [Casimicrobiaceae bacterium]